MDELGHYEPDGESVRWIWDKGKAPRVTAPEGEFNPLDPEPEEPKPKKAEPKKAEK